MLTLDKGFEFLEKADFKQIYRHIHGNHKYDQYSGLHTVAWRLPTLAGRPKKP